MLRDSRAAADEGPREASGTPAIASPSPERVMRTCPVCGAELAERKCRLFCPRPGCGYFLSCADFY
ncbi:MAG TPA: hypothetical protein VI942_01665 [Thermoanaerobaculia bacterium]|nr:hypothetical protein [Thermoanaerobaculia bacterium]